MFSQFLKSQMDYVFFVYDWHFFILAAASSRSVREKSRVLHGFYRDFGITHGSNEWLDLLSIGLGDRIVFDFLQVIVLSLSFVFLIEFGRKGTISLTGKGPGRWIHIPLNRFRASWRHSGVLTSYCRSEIRAGFDRRIVDCLRVFYVSPCSEKPGSRVMLLAAAGMTLYAFASCVSALIQAFPATLINDETFLKVFHFPVQILRGAIDRCCSRGLVLSPGFTED